MTALTFSVLMFSTRLSPDQKAIDKRMFDIKLAQGQAASEANGLLLAGPDAGPFAFVDSLLRRYKVSAGLQRLILQSNVPLTIGKLLFFCAACGAGLFVVSYVIKEMLLLSLVAGLQGFFWPILYLRWKRSRKLAAFDAGLADSIDMMARSLRAGHAGRRPRLALSRNRPLNR